MSVPKCITVFHDCTWEVSIVGKKLDNSYNILKNMPNVLDESSIKELIKNLAETKICAGNKDFVDFMQKKSIKGYAIDRFLAEDTVRSVNCKLVVEDEKCNVCSIQRSDLISRRNRQSLSSPLKARASSCVKLQSLTRKQLINRAKNLQKDRVKVQQLEKRLKDRIHKIFKNESVVLSDESSRDIEKVVKGASAEIERILVDNSPQKILWQEQMKVLKTKHKRQMRWHPTIIRWAIAVHSKSPAVYKLIKDSGFLILPAIGTLNKYTHFAEAKTGVHCEIIQQMVEEMMITEEYQKNVTLV